jgi:hypothetical protein
VTPPAGAHGPAFGRRPGLRQNPGLIASTEPFEERTVSEPSAEDIRMSAEDLYLEEVFTDRRVGTIQRLTPVTPDGDRDEGRDVLYVGQASLMTPAGSLPINFEIQASSLSEAVAAFGENAQVAVQDAIQQLQEMRRDQASSLVLPGQGGGGGGMPGGGSGGGGGGGIQLR